MKPERGIRLMIAPEIREAMVALRAKGTAVRKIARLLREPQPAQPQISPHLLPLLQESFARCEGNVVRVQEVLKTDHGITIPYSTLTRWVREAALRAPKQRARHDDFDPGEERQFDTSPHRLTVGDRNLTAQCAALALAYSRRHFIQ
jgi:hypothetical protein